MLRFGSVIVEPYKKPRGTLQETADLHALMFSRQREKMRVRALHALAGISFCFAQERSLIIADPRFHVWFLVRFHICEPLKIGISWIWPHLYCSYGSVMLRVSLVDSVRIRDLKNARFCSVRFGSVRFGSLPVL